MRRPRKKPRREHLNVFVDASLIYLDHYSCIEGTKLEIRWFKGGLQARGVLSTIEFPDEIRSLVRWREATFAVFVFGTRPDPSGRMDQPLMLEAVNEQVTREGSCPASGGRVVEGHENLARADGLWGFHQVKVEEINVIEDVDVAWPDVEDVPVPEKGGNIKQQRVATGVAKRPWP